MNDTFPRSQPELAEKIRPTIDVLRGIPEQYARFYALMKEHTPSSPKYYVFNTAIKRGNTLTIHNPWYDINPNNSIKWVSTFLDQDDNNLCGVETILDVPEPANPVLPLPKELTYINPDIPSLGLDVSIPKVDFNAFPFTNSTSEVQKTHGYRINNGTVYGYYPETTEPILIPAIDGLGMVDAGELLENFVRQSSETTPGLHKQIGLRICEDNGDYLVEANPATLIAELFRGLTPENQNLLFLSLQPTLIAQYMELQSTLLGLYSSLRNDPNRNKINRVIPNPNAGYQTDVLQVANIEQEMVKLLLSMLIHKQFVFSK